jgi:hypothetical protein
MGEKINLIFADFLKKYSLKKFWGFRALNIQSFKKNQALKGLFRMPIINCILIICTVFAGRRQRPLKGFKVIHTIKNLFCNVALICNLVQEFNGLVSKGLAI